MRQGEPKDWVTPVLEMMSLREEGGTAYPRNVSLAKLAKIMYNGKPNPIFLALHAHAKRKRLTLNALRKE